MNRENELVIDTASLTDIGLNRSNNEDSFGCFREEGESGEVLLVLADGMGGASAGEVASQMAVEVVHETYYASSQSSSPGERMQGALEKANREIHGRTVKEPELTGMGTTCTAALISGSSLTLAHVGDSRAYLVHDGAIEQLTEDHTLVAEAEKTAGKGSAPAWIPRHLLTRSVGVGEQVEVDVLSLPGRLLPGDSLILCSDGLSNVIQDSELLQITLDEPSGPSRVICKKMVDLALERGGPDNITVQVARFERSASDSPA